MRTVLVMPFVVACLIACSPVAPSAALPMRAGTLTPESILGMQGVGEVVIAPDGERIAYVVSVPRPVADGPGVAYQEVWVVSGRDGAPRRFTPEKQRAWAPEFSPDGMQLAFLSTRPTPGVADAASDATGLFALPIEGGEARLLSDGKLSVNTFHWSPRGNRIAFTAHDPQSDAEKKDQKAGRDQVVVDAHPKATHLWTVDVATLAVTRVTTNEVHVLAFDWSPDAERFALRVTDTPRVDEDYLYSRLALVAATGGEPAPLARTAGKLGAPVFAPNGRFVAWLGATDLSDPFPGSVFVAPIAGGEPVEVTRGHAGCVTAVRWLDDRTLALAATRSTQSVLEIVPRTGGTPRIVLTAGPVFTEFALSHSGKRIAFAGNTAECPNEVFSGTLDRSRTRVRRLTTTNAAIEQAQLGMQSTFRWQTPDGLAIDGVLVKPLGFTDGQRYPLVVVVHGGPESCVRDGWNTGALTWTQLLARDGYLVLSPNYRGSIGRDESFERGDHGDLMGQEFNDVLSGIDALVALGWVDEARVGICGGSYGGYTTAWAATAHSARFAAAIDFAGITNWVSMQGTSDIPEENAVVHWDRPFYANMDLYWERSPLSHVNGCRTPLLLLHGEADPRVPVTQSAEMYTALRLLGREVEFVRYPREGHGLKETAHQQDAMVRALAWFNQHLQPGTPRVTSRR